MLYLPGYGRNSISVIGRCIVQRLFASVKSTINTRVKLINTPFELPNTNFKKNSIKRKSRCGFRAWKKVKKPKPTARYKALQLFFGKSYLDFQSLEMI